MEFWIGFFCGAATVVVIVFIIIAWWMSKVHEIDPGGID